MLLHVQVDQAVRVPLHGLGRLIENLLHQLPLDATLRHRAIREAGRVTDLLVDALLDLISADLGAKLLLLTVEAIQVVPIVVLVLVSEGTMVFLDIGAHGLSKASCRLAVLPATGSSLNLNGCLVSTLVLFELLSMGLFFDV